MSIFPYGLCFAFRQHGLILTDIVWNRAAALIQREMR